MMQFSASFTSINGSTEGTIEWEDIDTESSSLTVDEADITLAESSGMVSFESDGKTIIEFETGDAPTVDPDPIEYPELPPWSIDHPVFSLFLFA
jgi:hypothetical protein